MIRTLLIAPELLHQDPEHSVVADPPLFGNVKRIRSEPEAITPELAYFGLPTDFHVSSGAILVAALKKDPPAHAVRFHVSLGCLDHDLGTLVEHGTLPSPQEETVLEASIAKLARKSWTPLFGRGLDHALVWEHGSLEHQTTPYRDALDQPYQKCLPEGDGETVLRQWIDDSINLLESLEFNRVRREEGQKPLNILWPWGGGFAPQLPNLTLAYQAPVTLLGNSLELEGLARLLNVRFISTETGFKANWTELQNTQGLPTLIFCDAFAEARRHHRFDRAQQLWSRVLKQWWEPQTLLEAPWKIGIVSPSHLGEGLALTAQDSRGDRTGVPFHERVLGDEQLALIRLCDFVSGFLRPSLS